MAFGGRRLDDDDKSPKYLNSNDSLIFKKRENLFALNFAKKQDSKTLILVEGYMDVISLHQRGIKTAVASLGTALTEGQGKLLRKYSDKVIFSYDSDGPGQNAILAGDSVLEKVGIEGRVLQIDVPGIKDPDEYIIKYGSGRFNLLIDNAISMVEFKTKMLMSKYNLENAGDKIRFLKEVSILISKVSSKIEREIYINKIAETYKISKEAIFAEVNKILYSNADDSQTKLTKPPQAKKEDVAVTEENKVELEREKMILYFFIKNYEEYGEKIIAKVSPDDFEIDRFQNVYNKILNLIEAGNNNINECIENIEDTEFQSAIAEILFADYEINSNEKFLEEMINNYKKNKLTSRKNEILNIISTGNLTKDEMANLENELNSLIIELARIK